MMKEPGTITTLFIDIGGVLLTNGWDRKARSRAADHFGLEFQEMDERHHLTFNTYEEGKISLEEYLGRVVFYQDRPFSLKQFTDYMYEQSQAFPGMIELVSAIKDRHNLEIAAVSNEGRELTMYRVDKFRLRDFIDFFISSCFVHYRKPDEDIYRIALDVAQVKPEEVVYLDDRPMFVDVAQKMGIHGIVHRTPSATRAALNEFGLKVDN
ncbi:MAG: HAD family phosphatase [Anaerolineales bacterium]